MSQQQQSQYDELHVPCTYCHMTVPAKNAVYFNGNPFCRTIHYVIWIDNLRKYHEINHGRQMRKYEK
jgi:hypothetical protein